MTKDTTKAAAVAADIMLFDNWFDSIEGGVRERVRGFIETMLEEELDGALCRPRYGRHKANGNEKAATLLVGCRHGHRQRALTAQGLLADSGHGLIGRSLFLRRSHADHPQI